MKVYQKKEKRKMKDLFFGLIRLLTILAVGYNAYVIITLSIDNTMKFAEMLGLPPRGAMFLVEVAFALLLALRAIQRSLRLNIPTLLNVGYVGVFCLLTAVNVYSLYQKNPQLGPYGGLAISGLMWLFENILVWLFTKSNQPYRKGILKQYFDAIRQAWEQKMIQKIAWVKFDSQRPDLALVKQVRKAEKKREKVIGNEELPEFFEWLKKQGDVEQITLELERTEPKVVDVDANVQLPVKRIGFHVEPFEHPLNESNTPNATERTPNRQTERITKTKQAYRTALKIIEEKEEKPSVRELARIVGCSVSTAQAALKMIDD